MTIGIGTDIIEVERIKSICEKYGQRFLDRIYTKEEQKYSNSFNDTKYQHYAARFAVKESFSKAIGTGITRGFKFKEIGIINEKSGQPRVVLAGKLKEKWGQYRIHVSLSHTEENAISYLIIEE
jgi:holo-[acyl-carrier protein] synthase